MTTVRSGPQRGGALLAALLLGGAVAGLATPPAQAQAPAYLDIMTKGPVTPLPSANENVLALNAAMFGLYGASGKIFQRNIMAQHPIILGLFNGAGGRFILYRPGQAPLEAPSVPIVYQLLKSVGHSTMVLPVIAGPRIDKPTDQSWRAPMEGYRQMMRTALDGLDQTSVPAAWRDDVRIILQDNINFIDENFARGSITLAGVQAFASRQGPRLKRIIAWAAETQVAHWMTVLAEWKRMLGPDWEKTYAASNTIYVARQNNILFSVLAQFFGPEAINQRLILIETVSFTTTPEDMLDSMTRILSDRIVGQLFFGNLYMMDYELMGGSARDAITAEAPKHGLTAFLPPLVPFGSKQWPTLITGGSGPGTLLQLP